MDKKSDTKSDIAWYKENIKLLEISLRTRNHQLDKIKKEILNLRVQMENDKIHTAEILEIDKQDKETLKSYLKGNTRIAVYVNLRNEVNKLKELVKKAKVKELEAKQKANIAKGKKPKKTEKELEDELEKAFGYNRFD